MGRFADILAGSAQKTDQQLASEISSVTKLTDAEIGSMFSSKPDKEKLLKLLEIVNSATDENKKVAQLKSNIEELAGVVVTLMKVIV